MHINTTMEADLSAKSLMGTFYALQEERVQTYQLFEEGFTAYLGATPNYNFPMYRQLVHEITKGFKKISDDIISISHRLESTDDWMVLASFINTIQDKEKEKLELTVQMQLARQNHIDHSEDESYSAEIDDIKNRINGVIETITEQLEELKYESEDLYTADEDR